MAEKYGITDAEFKTIQAQAVRRAEMRREFLKQRTNPWKQAAESAYVFDTAHQRFLSMKVTHLERFVPTASSAIFAMCSTIIPMCLFGWFCVKERGQREELIRSGQLLYKDRLFKLV